jgi:hypothetical protein
MEGALLEIQVKRKRSSRSWPLGIGFRTFAEDGDRCRYDGTNSGSILWIVVRRAPLSGLFGTFRLLLRRLVCLFSDLSPVLLLGHMYSSAGDGEPGCLYAGGAEQLQIPGISLKLVVVLVGGEGKGNHRSGVEETGAR